MHSYKPKFKSPKLNNEVIKEMDESKEMDVIQKELNNQVLLKSEFYQQGTSNSKLSEVNEKTVPQTQLPQTLDKYSTSKINRQTHKQSHVQYRSGGFPSTQPTSPHNKFSTEKNFKQQRKDNDLQNDLKKKLFFQQIQNSPQFNLKEQNIGGLSYTFKKRIDDYQRQFGLSSPLQRKLTFENIDFRKKQEGQENTDENDPNALNRLIFDFEKPHQGARKQLKFENENLEQQNSIIQQINAQIRRDNIEKDNVEKDYQKIRKNQSDLIKRKILESKSDLKRFYQPNSSNVEYEYRKAKFMDIFLGTKTIQQNLY